MKIGIDISQIIYGTGVSWYTKNLIENLLKLRTDDEYVLFGGSLRRINDLKAIVNKFKGRYSSKYYPIPPVIADYIWNKVHILPIETLIGKVDVIHTSDWTEPPCRAPKVTTIHDLSAVIYPESVTKDSIRDITSVHLNKFKWVKKEVDRIIAVSESTKQDIVKFLGIGKDRIEVIHEAPDDIYQKKSSDYIESVKRKYGVEGDYLLSVGTGKRKNNTNVFKAISGSSDLKKIVYVIAGHGTEQKEKGLVFIKDPSREEIAALYSGAKALVYASSYEGFGLPILEAYACECPVVTSNISSMPEIAGDAAILIDPDSIESIANGIRQALINRDNLIGKGNLRVKDFNWETTARKTLEVYRKVYKGK